MRGGCSKAARPLEQFRFPFLLRNALHVRVETKRNGGLCRLPTPPLSEGAGVAGVVVGKRTEGGTSSGSHIAQATGSLNAMSFSVFGRRPTVHALLPALTLSLMNRWKAVVAEFHKGALVWSVGQR